MATLTSSLIVRLIDQVSGPARQAVASLRGIGAAARGAVSGTGMTALSTRMQGEAKKLRAAIGSVGGAVSTGVTGLGLYKFHQDVMDFATATDKLAAANPDVTAEQIGRIKDLARDITRSSLFDPATVMNAANALARADVSIAAIEGALKPLANAAMAADVPVSDLADDFVKLASGFGLAYKTKKQAAETFSYLADLAQYVAQKAPGTFTDFVQAMKYVAPSVRALGVDIQWLAGAYIMLDKAGIRNAEAGNALRSMMKHMVQPTHAARAMYAQLGIDVATFLKQGKAADANQLVNRFKAEFGKDMSRIAPQLQQILDRELPLKEKGLSLFTALEKQWGTMKPQDARKLKKSIDGALLAATEQIDPERWIKVLNEKGVTFGQFLQLVEPRQAMRLKNLMQETLSPEGAAKVLETPIAQMAEFKRGLADLAADRRMQGYPGAVAKVRAAWHTFIESLDKVGVIEALASALERLGLAIANVFKGGASLGDWTIALAALSPLLGPIALALIGIGKAVSLVVSGLRLMALLLLVPLAKAAAWIGGIAVAVAGSTAAIVAFVAAAAGILLALANWERFKALLESFTSLKPPEWLDNIGTWFESKVSAGWQMMASLVARLIEGLEAAFPKVSALLKQLAERISSELTTISLYDIGAKVIDSLWEGAKSKVESFLSWLSGIGARIKGAIGGALGGVPLPGSAAPQSAPATPGPTPGPHAMFFQPGHTAPATKPAGGSFAPQINVTVHGGADGRRIAETVGEELRKAYADYGFVTAAA